VFEHPQELQAGQSPNMLAGRAADRRINFVVHEVADDSEALVAHSQRVRRLRTIREHPPASSRLPIARTAELRDGRRKATGSTLGRSSRLQL
jgi:hypothetical protein